MCSVLKIGIYGENRDFFGEVEENVQSLFFNLDLSYDVIYLDNQIRITNPLDILFVNMSKLIHKASAKIENMLRNAGSHIVAIADNAEELLYAFKIKASTAMLRNNVKCVNDYDIIFKDYEEVVPLAVRRRKGLKEYMI